MDVTASSLPSDPYSIPLDQIDMSQPGLFQQKLHGAYFARLRKEDPVHYCGERKLKRETRWSCGMYPETVMRM